MIRNLAYVIVCFLLSQSIDAQSINGIVLDNNDEPLFGASVHWLNTNSGTITDENGGFLLNHAINSDILIIGFVGYEPDTILVKEEKMITVKLNQTKHLKEVLVVGDKEGTFISKTNPAKVQVITQLELTKGACCDLAGCFNSEGSVQPTTTNLITNSKELRILGLSGVYTQVLIDGMPLIQGLSYTYGISSYPGTLVDNIYIVVGTNSVLQGFESINGQINIQLKDPEKSEKLLLNVYMNSFLEKQLNINYSHKFKKWKTILAVHTTQPSDKFDEDEDGFLDLPLITRYSIYNKWTYGNKDKWGLNALIGLRYVNEMRIGGQLNFDPKTDRGTTKNYGQTLSYSQPEVYSKIGYRLNSNQNMVFNTSLTYHDQNSYFGTTSYKATQLHLYNNMQYELKWKKNHLFKAGISHRHINQKENILFTQNDLGRTYDGDHFKNETIIGVFTENVFKWKADEIVLITGLRMDHHNEFGLFATPRILFKYELAENTTARVSAGTGYRTVNLFSENINLLASSRDIIISEQIKPERAFNWGINLLHNAYWDNLTATFGIDFYRTSFKNQIFPDYDSDPTKAIIRNFSGTSISNGFQSETNLKFYKVFDLKISYNYLDVYQEINEGKYVLPFNPKHKVISAISYKPRSKKWHFDMNVHWFSEQRLANTSSNPHEYQSAEKSSPYTIVNTQFTKTWKELDVYFGVENVFDFRQSRPIISWQEPFGRYFDTSNAWGPTKGREYYLGIRFRIK